MKSSNLTLGAALNSPNQYVIPVFRRYYRWDQPEWVNLWDDPAELLRPGRCGQVAVADPTTRPGLTKDPYA